MSHRFFASIGALAAVIVVVSLAFVSLSGQAQSATETESDWTAPRTPWGDPDLQGIWNNGTITPLERPRDLADREFLTDEEVAALNENARTRDDRSPAEGSVGFYNGVWWDRGVHTGRTSLIVDPPEGRIPPRTPEGQARIDSRTVRFVVSRAGTVFDGPEDLTLTERCILMRSLPRLPTGYNNNYLIVQTPEHVGLVQEQNHEVRIIPLDGRPHLSPKLRQWLGDSRGRWEGDTLVVETINFTPRTEFRGSRENLHLIERFTRVDADTIDYQFTVEDPTTWTRPWTAAIPMVKTEGPILEYACHEGNQAVRNSLTVSRADEQAAAPR